MPSASLERAGFQPFQAFGRPVLPRVSFAVPFCIFSLRSDEFVLTSSRGLFRGQVLGLRFALPVVADVARLRDRLVRPCRPFRQGSDGRRRRSVRAFEFVAPPASPASDAPAPVRMLGTLALSVREDSPAASARFCWPSVDSARRLRRVSPDAAVPLRDRRRSPRPRPSAICCAPASALPEPSPAGRRRRPRSARPLRICETPFAARPGRGRGGSVRRGRRPSRCRPAVRCRCSSAARSAWRPARARSRPARPGPGDPRCHGRAVEPLAFGDRPVFGRGDEDEGGFVARANRLLGDRSESSRTWLSSGAARGSADRS